MTNIEMHAAASRIFQHDEHGRPTRLPKLGKGNPKHMPALLHMSSYMDRATLAPPPMACSYQEIITDGMGWPMYGNDVLGDCTLACAGHIDQQQLVYTNKFPGIPHGAPPVGTTPLLTNQQIISAYEAVGGYVPGDESTDNGCVITDVLDYWRKHGIGGRKILAYVSVNPRLPNEVKTAMQLFGSVYLGVQLPLSCQGQGMWAAADGPAGAPGSWGGHAIPIVDYTENEYYVISWGERLMMTPTFLAGYCDEAYAILSTEWINTKLGVSPSGFNLAQLQADLAFVTGESLPKAA